MLRHQLMVLKCHVSRPRLRRRDRLFMAAISRTLPRARWSMFVVSPQTILRWHRELVRLKWTYRRMSTGGRPPISEEVRELILRMGRENPRWDASGSGASSPRSGSGSPRRGSGRSFGRTGWARLLAVMVPPGGSSRGARPRESWRLTFSLWRRRGSAALYVLFAIEIGSRRVRVLGVTRNPHSGWVAQQARNLAVGERHPRPPLPHPRSGCQVLPSVRRGLPLRGREDHRDPGPSPASERLRRALGPHSSDRVPGLDAGLWPPPPGAGPSDPHLSLQ